MTGATDPAHRLAVWSDFGGVLTPSAAESTRAFGERIGVRPEVLRRAVGTVTARYGVSDPMEPLDTPLVDEATWTRQLEQVLAEEHGLPVRIGDFGSHWFADRAVNEPWLAALRGLRSRGVFVGLLSNMVPSWERHWRAMVPAEELFDQVVVSHQVGCRKPDRRIFELAASLAGRPPEHCVLVDDLAANCAGARAAGWHAIEFSDAGSALDRLTTWLDQPGPAGAASTPVPHASATPSLTTAVHTAGRNPS
ncbi:HAD-IA family hydrolase [Kitasatospora sp. LaBMicrA B282]|uniref:HAD-IA family hydrolase n=1 Tax=Kitasatospora sp. LaBMicrA B282 TaxID=3420949 RepID=UPI003D13D2AB